MDCKGILKKVGGACGRGGRCGAKGRFFKEKAPQKPFAEGAAVPAETVRLPLFTLPQTPPSRAIQVIFRVFFSLAKRRPEVREKYGQKKARFLLPVFLSDWRRSQSFSSKNDAKSSCPPEKSFCGAFFKKRPSAPAGARHFHNYLPIKNRG